MKIEATGATSEEAAAIAVALEALLGSRVEASEAATPPSGWHLAARAFGDDYDAERALRRAKRRTI